MSARIYGHDDGTASLEVLRAIYANNPDGTPLTVVRSVDVSPMADSHAFVEVAFTPPALRALHTAIGIRLVETDRLQTGRPARLAKVLRTPAETHFLDTEGFTRGRVVGDGEGWRWHIYIGDLTGRLLSREDCERDVAALLRARGYVVEGA